jgi:hypothetical protein
MLTKPALTATALGTVVCASLFAPQGAVALLRGTPVGAATPSPDGVDPIGCYRLGLSGYRWYHTCFGPRWIYPHHRSCHRGWCRYSAASGPNSRWGARCSLEHPKARGSLCSQNAARSQQLTVEATVEHAIVGNGQLMAEPSGYTGF